MFLFFMRSLLRDEENSFWKSKVHLIKGKKKKMSVPGMNSYFNFHFSLNDLYKTLKQTINVTKKET